MTDSNDLKLNREVRRILVKHYVDLGRLAVRSQRGRVTIFGHLQRVMGALEPLTPPIVEAMFYEIGRLRLASKINVRLDNWAFDGGKWKRVEKEIGDSPASLKKKAALKRESRTQLKSGHKERTGGDR